jgi:hypothetical protein
MSRTAYVFFFAVATATSLAASACSSGDIAVGSTSQALKVKKDGGATGDGKTCSWDDTVASDGTTTSAPGGAFKVGDPVPSGDCNSCSCTESGISCTTIAPCPPPTACTEEAKQCPDGSSVGRTGPNCEFAPCPGAQACDTLAKLCPDGSAVGRTGPNCEFAPCPGGPACSLDGPNTCPAGTTCKVPEGLPTRNGTCQ